jgi:hypothetical protein
MDSESAKRLVVVVVEEPETTSTTSMVVEKNSKNCTKKLKSWQVLFRHVFLAFHDVIRYLH